MISRLSAAAGGGGREHGGERESDCSRFAIPASEHDFSFIVRKVKRWRSRFFSGFQNQGALPAALGGVPAGVAAGPPGAAEAS